MISRRGFGRARKDGTHKKGVGVEKGNQNWLPLEAGKKQQKDLKAKKGTAAARTPKTGMGRSGEDTYQRETSIKKREDRLGKKGRVGLIPA